MIGFPLSIIAGGVANISVQLRDTYGNVVTLANISNTSFSINSSTGSSDLSLTALPISQGSGSYLLSLTASLAISRFVNVYQGSVLLGGGVLVVSPATVSASRCTASTQNTAMVAGSSGVINIVARDMYGNVNSAGTFSFNASMFLSNQNAAAQFSSSTFVCKFEQFHSQTECAATQYVISFVPYRSGVNNTIKLYYNGQTINSTLSVNVTAGAVSSGSSYALPSSSLGSFIAGSTVNFTLILRDQYNNTWTGLVTVSDSLSGIAVSSSINQGAFIRLCF